ncbi:MAG: hypothetical protein HYT46_03330 [Candidatus Vogelbacteria bacterium]|nr:hypothetical protein [Candidatus Vogelbacteria bacterium]
MDGTVMQGWIDNPKGLQEFLRDLCPPEEESSQKAVEKSTVRPAYKLVVNYDQTLAEMIAAGRYDSVNSSITAEHFPVTGRGQQAVEVELFHFGRVMSSEQVMAELDRVGYRPTRIEELLALGAARPDLQRQFPIIALGSPWRNLHGYRRVTYLGEWHVKRKLSLHWFGSDWW